MTMEFICKLRYLVIFISLASISMCKASEWGEIEEYLEKLDGREIDDLVEDFDEKEVTDLVKRTSYHLGKMSECARPDLSIVDLWGYGCWCGPGGKGKPIDAFDRCCQAHDYCYNDVRKDKSCKITSTWQLYVLYYKTNSCKNKKQTCKSKSRYGWGWKVLETPVSCRVRKCSCDYVFSQCIRRNKWNRKYKGYSNDKC